LLEDLDRFEAWLDIPLGMYRQRGQQVGQSENRRGVGMQDGREGVKKGKQGKKS